MEITPIDIAAILGGIISAFVAIRKEGSDMGGAAADMADGVHLIISPLNARIHELAKENAELKASGEKGKKVLARKVKRHIKILRLCGKMINDTIDHIQTLKIDEDHEGNPLTIFPETPEEKL